MSTVTKGKDWRDSSPYRAAYFRKNPGIGGKLWFCSYCGRPLWGKGKVQVDHILPPSHYAEKKVHRDGTVSNTSRRAELLNNTFNLVASCPKCNGSKSDKMGRITVRGYFAKIVEVTMYKLQDVVVLGAWGGKSVVASTVGGVLPKSVKRGYKSNQKPKIASNSLITILIVILLYVISYSAFLVVKYGKSIIWNILKTCGKIIFLPILSKKTAWWVKLFAVAAYCVLIYYFWDRLAG